MTDEPAPRLPSRETVARMMLWLFVNTALLGVLVGYLAAWTIGDVPYWPVFVLIAVLAVVAVRIELLQRRHPVPPAERADPLLRRLEDQARAYPTVAALAVVVVSAIIESLLD